MDNLKSVLLNAGSSPRGWGTRRGVPGPQPGERFIPTRVGNTQTLSASSAGWPVHPHAGGEHDQQFRDDAGQLGSSPRGWGTLEFHRPELHRLRFIPTRVGNTPVRSHGPMRGAVHPHAGGEHSASATWAASCVGSSPRGWGTPGFGQAVIDEHRFIPTRVGNTISMPMACCSRAVHPHAGGEHRRPLAGVEHETGSSPRGWGTHQLDDDMSPEARFSPTRVGNTASASARMCSSTVHPHAGGEHGHHPRSSGLGNGSSPRGWGTRAHQLGERIERRFIPTRVGNTGGWRGRTRTRSVHPHAGGEHQLAIGRIMCDCGSSPRGWGTRYGRKH